MNRITRSLAFALITSLLTATAVFALFTNGGFESGDFTGWTESAFINQGFGQPPGTGGSDLSAVVGGLDAAPMSFADPNSGGKIRYPALGHFSARVNSDLSYSGGGHPRNADTIAQTVAAVLDPTDSKVHVRFMYAAVMVKPVYNPHDADHNPYFRIRAINTSNRNDVLFDFSTYVGKPGQTWKNGIAFGTRGDVWQYLDWTSVDLASSDAHPVHAGDKITLKITAAGCSLGGHPGYIYVDGISDGDEATGLSIQAEGPATAIAGSTITYTYTYKNGSDMAVNPTIVINPPQNVTFTTLSDAVHCSGTSPVTCNFTSVPAGGTGSFTVTGNIALAAAGTTIVHDNYTITATGLPTVSGNAVTTQVLAGTGDLTISASGAATVKPGDQYTYTLSYTANASVSNAQVHLTLPGHTTFVSSDRSCAEASGVVTCDLGTLNPGAGSFSMVVLVDKLKKIDLPLTLASTAYSISGSNATPADGLTTVTADVLSPFADVPEGHPELDYIQALWAAGITSGCSQSPLMYCPDRDITRGETAVMIERAMGNFAPTPNPSGMFADVPYPGIEPYTPFIEQFYNDGISGGCSVNPLMFCPQENITRGQMAVFIERGMGNFTPTPNPTGMFADVPYPGLEPFTPFIEELYNDGISSGCSTNPLMFCPQDFVRRSEMAIYIQRAFDVPMPS